MSEVFRNIRCSDGSSYNITKKLSVEDELKLFEQFGNPCYTACLGDDSFMIDGAFLSGELSRQMDTDLHALNPDIKKRAEAIIRLLLDSAEDVGTRSKLTLTHFSSKMGVYLEFLGLCLHHHLSSLIYCFNSRSLDVCGDLEAEGQNSAKMYPIVLNSACGALSYMSILPVSAARQQALLFEIAAPMKVIRENLREASIEAGIENKELAALDLSSDVVSDKLLMALIIIMSARGKFYTIYDNACKGSCFIHSDDRMLTDGSKMAKLSDFQGDVGQLLSLLRHCIKVNLSDFFTYQTTPNKN